MKVLMCTSVVVVLLVAGVQAQPPADGRGGPGGQPYMKEILDQIVSESCQDNEEQCRSNAPQCFKDITMEKIETEAQLATLKTNLAACATEIGASDADFSTLALATFTNQQGRAPAFDPVDYGVTRDLIPDLFKCMMDKEGKLATLTACITGSS